MRRPPTRTKLAFWLLLGLLSAAVAEVVSGAAPFVLVTASGLLVTLPVYLLHAAFLAGIVYRFSGRLDWRSLYLAGVLFGLYEAYLTKVLWAPTWDPIPVTLGGVYVLETGLLVNFWHPLLAFLLPLLAAERLAARSRIVTDGLPRRVRDPLVASPRFRLGLAALLGLFQGAVAPDVRTSLASALATVVVLLAAVTLWRRRVGADRYDVGDLLPTRRELVPIGLLLAAMYVGYGVGLRPDHLPGIPAQATVWLLYFVFGALLSRQLRADRQRPATAVPASVGAVPLRPLLPIVGAYVVAVAAGGLLLGGIATPIFVGLYVVAVLVGAVLLGRIVLDLVRGGT